MAAGIWCRIDPTKALLKKYYLCEVLPSGVLVPLYNKFGWRLEYFKTIKEAQVYVKYWDFTLEAM